MASGKDGKHGPIDHERVGGWRAARVARVGLRVVVVGGLAVLGVMLAAVVVSVFRLVLDEDVTGGTCAVTGDRLIDAAFSGREQDVESALAEGADPDRMVRGRTALFCAVAALGTGDDDSAEGETADQVAVIRALLDGGGAPDLAADINSLDLSQWRYPTPLLLAARHGHTEAVDALLEGGADPELVVEGQVPLGAAAAGGHLEVVELLLGAGVDPEGTGRRDGSEPMGEHRRTPLEHAAGNGHVQVIDRLLEAGATLRPSVVRAAAGGDTCIAEEDEYRAQYRAMEHLLEEYDVDPDGAVQGPSPLLCAAWSGNTALVELLLDHGADPDYGGEIDVVLAALAWVTDVPELPPALEDDLFAFLPRAASELVEEDDGDASAEDGSDRPVENVPPIVAAVWRNEAGIAVRLLDAGADPDRSVEDGLNPMFAAAVQDHQWAVELLLDHGADPAPTVGRRPWTPAAVAVRLGHDEVVDALEPAPG